MKTRYALTFYYLVTGLLAACAIIIVMKLLLFPPCTPTGANGSLCTVDGWSIAGLAATVLGVAAAILTILGAFSVAYWWAELDKRVNKQVTQLFNEQKAALNDEVDDLLQQQKKKVNDLLQTQTERIEDQGRQVDKTKRDLEQMREQIDSIIDLTFSVASVNPPWVLEEWAKDITAKFKTPEAAKQMVLSYLQIVDGLLPERPPKFGRYSQNLRDQHAPSTDIIYYWQKALEWEHVITEYYKGVIGVAVFAKDGSVTQVEPPILRQVRESTNERRPKIEDWKSRNGL